MKLSISYLSMEKRTDEEMNKLNQTNADYIHVDIMDGRFVKNQTEDDDQQIAWLKEAQKPLDIHFMVKNVNKYIDLYECLKPEYITFHVEATKDIVKTIEAIKSRGIKVGLSLKPHTDLYELMPYLSLIDLVLIMSVEPGAGGQEFIPASVKRLQELLKIRAENQLAFKIEMDGGLNSDTIRLVPDLDMAVSGSFVCNSDHYQERIEALKVQQ